MEKKNNKPVLFIGLLVIVFLTIGVTLAYYTTTDTFNNEFNTGNYSIQTQEAFVSPDNWTPGTTTPKTVIATNKGNTPAAVRIKLTPSWEDKNGDPLPLTDGTNEAAIINFASNLNSKWIYDNGYYYYKKALSENESTSSLLNSVTFNPAVSFDETKDCDTVNGVTTCTTTFNDYAGGKYTLRIDVETAQFDKYKEIWGTDVNLKTPVSRDNILMTNLYDYDNPQTFGKDIDRDNFESITTVDNVNIPNDAIDSWDCSEAQNESVMCWYTNANAEDEDEYSTYYELYIGQEGGVVANPNSKEAFARFSEAGTIDLTKLDTSIVTDMSYMFENNGYSKGAWNVSGLSNFDTSNVTDMSYMFSSAGYYASTFNPGDLSNFDTSNVTNMKGMFSSAGFRSTTWNIGDISNWDTSQVTDMSFMFSSAGYKATTFNLNLSNWDTSKVTTMSNTFENIGYSATTWNIGNLNNWDTSQVTDMNYMFYCSGYTATTWSIGNLSNWDTSKVTNMTSMFSYAGYKAPSFELNLSNWNTSSVEYMYYTFYHTGYNATTWSIGDLSNWNTSNVINMVGMFRNAAYKATTFDIGDLSDWDTSNVTTMFDMFNQAGYSATTWNSIGTLDVYATTITNMFNGCRNAKGTLNIYNNPTAYSGSFTNASIIQGSGITVNYSSTTTNIDRIIATKSGSSNVVKGSQLN